MSQPLNYQHGPTAEDREAARTFRKQLRRSLVRAALVLAGSAALLLVVFYVINLATTISDTSKAYGR